MMTEQIKINWYRCKVDKALMSELIRTSDWQGFHQVLLQLGLTAATGTLAFLAYGLIRTETWWWAVPLLLAALFAHGTVASFLGYVPVHELCHKTPFKTKAWNEFFLKVYSFLSWADYIWFRPSHVKHHQLTVHHDYDGEVVLPQSLSIKDWKFWCENFAWNPLATWSVLRQHCYWATGRIIGRAPDDDWWYRFILPESNAKLRREHRNWARLVLLGHGVLAAAFVLTGHWILVVIFTFQSHYCRWLATACGTPQHFGLSPNVPDFRLCCRTYTCSGLPAFLYWNMQYHIEHHMFPAVPFYNLPRLRKAIEHDLPPAPHGLRATWKQILEIHKRQRTDPNFAYVPLLPGSNGDHAGDETLFREAASLKPGGVMEGAGTGGFSLVEIVMAMGIFSFAFLSVLGLLPMGMTNFQSSIGTSVSAQINQQVIGQAQETDFNSLPLLSGSMFYFDVDGRQIPGASGSVYQARAWVSQAPTLPGAVSPNSNISTVTVQIANNPSNQNLTPDPNTHLWSAQSGVKMRTFSTMVSGYCTVTGSTGS